MSATTTTGVLFVCHANMCRSPLAEGIFRHLARARGMLHQLHIDSAGSSAIEGCAPHPLSIQSAQAHGFELEGRGRQLLRVDLTRFEHVILMDRQNRSDLSRMLSPSAFGALEGFRATVRLIRELSHPQLSGPELDIQDPLRMGYEGYERMYPLLEHGCNALLDEIAAR